MRSIYHEGETRFFLTFLAALVVMVGLFAPRFVHGQTTATTPSPKAPAAAVVAPPAELSEAIRSAILSDPRVHNLSAEQLDKLVNSLATQAQSKGITVEALTWRPKPAQVFVPPTDTGAPVIDPYACGSFPRVFCAMSAAFGFTDASVVLPIALGVLALIVLLALILLYEHHRHQKYAEELTGPLHSTENPV